jgi:hypothetical protein
MTPQEEAGLRSALAAVNAELATLLTERGADPYYARYAQSLRDRAAELQRLLGVTA